MVANATRTGDSAGWPVEEKSVAKSRSRKIEPSVSYMRRETLPRGRAARATRAVSSGTRYTSCSWRDIAHLLRFTKVPVPKSIRGIPISSITQAENRSYGGFATSIKGAVEPNADLTREL